ncbi:hypothetical protein R5H30_15755 [Sulfitobacter sp. D35]|uniref:hypothetical protein n=1 Tax=Sulfitobacter sp. D35 TaxID=3083252 RepID=UPI00296FAC5E|nr:hypothetical protein [Sulfitobacter sp. D35]MDW4499448.1 hypothetical protein [Sulfitobacter sp. D35]
MFRIAMILACAIVAAPASAGTLRQIDLTLRLDRMAYEDGTEISQPGSHFFDVLESQNDVWGTASPWSGVDVGELIIFKATIRGNDGTFQTGAADLCAFGSIDCSGFKVKDFGGLLDIGGSGKDSRISLASNPTLGSSVRYAFPASGGAAGDTVTPGRGASSAAKSTGPAGKPTTPGGSEPKLPQPTLIFTVVEPETQPGVPGGPAVIPLPGTGALMIGALGLFAGIRHRRRKG